jgi:hypothetical protein
MDRLSAVLEYIHPAMRDQTSLPDTTIDAIIKHGLDESVSNLDRLAADPEKKAAIISKTIQATERVFTILQTIFESSTQIVFSGASSDLSYKMLVNSTGSLKTYPDISRLLPKSVHLDSDQNQSFRSKGWSFRIHQNAVIVDEYATYLTKASQLLSGPLNNKKMVIFAIAHPDTMTKPALEDFARYGGDKLFYGLMDNEFADFMTDLACVRSRIVSINGKYGVLHDDTMNNIRWDRSKLSSAYEQIVLRAEAVDTQWQSILSTALANV